MSLAEPSHTLEPNTLVTHPSLDSRAQHPAIRPIAPALRKTNPPAPSPWHGYPITILEDQLSYQTVDELATNDLLKLSLATGLSPTLKTALTQTVNPTLPSADTLPETQTRLRLPWQ
ncbi:hypothetical protein [Stenomitos frigidus]|uniref:Uncharacterized protein n=1 Tax=Stenomitos frigidus ULC18 TaxID=2107698 RepID=A0A2T1EME5_9CYAN|nr:hypothetical protein [Stenomitos frigidus]PSB33919.1 hypothetical protein C7B82_03385 [Stenomitos frigidus ULC18]